MSRSENSGPLHDDAALRAIAEGVEAETGEQFFSSLVRHLSSALACQYSFVTQLHRERGTFETLAVFGRGQMLPNFEVPLRGTPCERVLEGNIAHIAENVQQLYPEDKGLADWGAISYCGVPLLDPEGRCVGHLAILDDKPMLDGPRGIAVLRIFAARARAEIERMRIEAALCDSEFRFRDLYENAPLPIVSSTPDGRFVRWNRRFASWTGYTDEQLRTLSPRDFYPRDEVEAQGIAEVRRRWLEREDFEMEFRVRLADGRVAWVRGAIRPICDSGGNVVLSEGILADITDRKRAEDALRVSEERLSRVIGSALDAIITFDSSLKIELFNQAAERIFGVAANDAIGTLLDRFLTENFARVLKDSIAVSAEDGQGRPYVWAPGGLSARRANGSEFAIEATMSNVVVGGRQLFTLILRDMDERLRAEAEMRKLSLQNEYLQEEIKQSHNFDEIVGQSPSLAAVLEDVKLVAATDSSVLILGETGTGKELIARAVHSSSARKDRPLIKVNCAALPGGLIESELFGHEKGAFTGASHRRLGRFELANGGTIFLDEIGDMPTDVQAKLLRVLQEHEFERVGGQQTIRVDVRVIAATNRDLEKAVEGGSFRSDLYYRLNVFPLRLPPLREHTEDIPLLVHFFARRYAAKTGRQITRISKDTMDRLVAYQWPGNVRELENVIERAVILSRGPELEVAKQALPLAAVARASKSGVAPGLDNAVTAGGNGGGRSLEDIERNHILAVLKRNNWRIEGVGGAAQELKMNPSTLRNRLKKLGIRRSADSI